MNSTRAVHRSLAHLLPKAAVAPSHRSALFARQPQLPTRPFTTVASMPRSRNRSSRDDRRRRSRDDSDDEDIDEVWRAGTTKPRSRRHDKTARSAEYDEFLRTRPAPAPTLSPREVPGTWRRSHPTVWTWTGTRIPERSVKERRARAGLLV